MFETVLNAVPAVGGSPLLLVQTAMHLAEWSPMSCGSAGAFPYYGELSALQLTALVDLGMVADLYGT